MKDFIYNIYAKKTLKKAEKTVKKSYFFYETYKNKKDEEIQNRYKEIFEIVNNGKNKKNSEYKKYIPELLALIKIASKRTLNMEPFDVQLIGAVILDQGKIAEMKTGEGKTLTAAIAAVINAVNNESVHIVTVNDYLAKRDAELMSPLYNFFNLNVGVIYSDQFPAEKYEMYSKNIVYATNTELGFDYLRDNTVYRIEDKVFKGNRFFAIIDEVDSILIDEARTPLIISDRSMNEDDVAMYLQAKELAKKMKENEDYEIDRKNKNVFLTEEGLNKAEKFLNLNNLYENKKGILFAHRLNNAVYAKELLKKDKDYTVLKNPKTGKEEIVLIDEFTGRLAIGKTLSDGLHQAIEAKEGVEITPENRTIAKITYPNFFSLYKKVSGMTGTALTQREEFMEVYGLEVIPIPTNKPVIRKDNKDMIFGSSHIRDREVVKKIKELHKKGQPVLVGTTSVETSERISSLLLKDGIKHEVLNAKNHEREAEIIAKAGEKGAVTISTNMAGRGTDIKLGEGVKELGGLYVIGVERNENRRIDDQLIGRSGRQGDPGASRFYLSLEDKLLQIFGGNSIKRVYNAMKNETQPIESGILTKAIKKAQKNIERMYSEMRKELLKYDNVFDVQRKMYYKMRDEILSLKTDEFIKKIERYTEEIGIDKEKEEKIKKVVEFVKENEDIDAELFFRTLFIRIMDEEFLDFLNALESLREGIHFRGMSQKDPLTEYKKESFILFNNFINNTKERILNEISQTDIDIVKDIMSQNSFEENILSENKEEYSLIGSKVSDILNSNKHVQEKSVLPLDEEIIFKI